MHPTLLLLERHRRELSSTAVHWFDLPEHCELVKPTDQVYCLASSENNRATMDTTDWPAGALNILFYPKAKDRLWWWLQKLQTQLTNTKRLWVVGENNGGVKSLAKRLKGHFACTKLDSARHCALYELELISPIENSVQWQNYTIGSLKIMALPGVFSANRLDKGTELLIEYLPTLSGAVLEFGAGAGVLTTLMAKQETASKVLACEIDLLAVQSSKKSLEINDVSDKAEIIWSDGLRNVHPEKFNYIVTNPPFHKGISTFYNASEILFSEAKNWLEPRGKLIWVANEFLSYQSIVEQHFSTVEQLAHKKGFKVYQATL